MQTIKMGGKERPIQFSNRVAYEFERLYTDRSYMAAADDLIRQIADIGSRMGTDSVEEAGKHLHIKDIVDLAYAALSYGARASRLSVDFDVYDVSEWLLDDMDALSGVITLLCDSLPLAKPEDIEAAKKKTAPPDGLIGKLGSPVEPAQA